MRGVFAQAKQARKGRAPRGPLSPSPRARGVSVPSLQVIRGKVFFNPSII